MAISAAEIQTVSFSIARKGGYDVEEVDDFLEHVAEEIEALNNYVTEMETKLDEAREAAQGAPAQAAGGEGAVDASEDVTPILEARIAELERQLEEKKADDTAISQALIVAQRSADEVLANARNEASNIIKDADEEADRIIGKAEGDRLKIIDSIRQLESDRTDVRSEYREMLANFMADAQKKLAEIDGDARRASASSQVRADMGASAYAPAAAGAAVPDNSLANQTIAADPIRLTGPAPVSSPAASGFIDKDLSGFGAADDEFAFDDID